MKAVLLISHGSRSPKTKKEVSALADELRQKSQVPIFEYAFLDVESPRIPEGIDHCVQKGATEIIVLLNFLNAGLHVDDDIPRIVKKSADKYLKVNFHITPPVGQHPAISDLFLDLIKS